MEIDPVTGGVTQYAQSDIGELAVYIRKDYRESGIWRMFSETLGDGWNYQSIHIGRHTGEFEILFYANRYVFCLSCG